MILPCVLWCHLLRVVFVDDAITLFFSYALSVLFDQGQWQGFSQLGVLDAFVGRIVIATLLPLSWGNCLDISVRGMLRSL